MSTDAYHELSVLQDRAQEEGLTAPIGSKEFVNYVLILRKTRQISESFFQTAWDQILDNTSRLTISVSDIPDIVWGQWAVKLMHFFYKHSKGMLLDHVPEIDPAEVADDPAGVDLINDLEILEQPEATYIKELIDIFAEIVERGHDFSNFSSSINLTEVDTLELWHDIHEDLLGAHSSPIITLKLCALFNRLFKKRIASYRDFFTELLMAYTTHENHPEVDWTVYVKPFPSAALEP